MGISSNKDKLIIISVIIIISFGIVYKIFNDKNISRKGVYVVGVIKKTSKNKSGYSVIADYYYKNKVYKTNFNPSFDFSLKVGRKFFLKILPNKPWKYNYNNIDVPNCVLNQDWQLGWKEIPTCE